MQSFGVPRATSNPYVHMLDQSLSANRRIEHLRFDRVRAMTGSYEALHFHWPETLLGGSTPLKRFARRLYASALLLRLRASKIAVVRTVHNVELPNGISSWERWFLQGIENRTDYRIRINAQTAPSADGPSTLILHGHFIDWFDGMPKEEAEECTLGFVGLIRRYKGVEALVEAFAETKSALPQATLRISGNPTSPSIAEEIRALAAADDRVQLELQYLSEPEFARAVTRSRGVILPYRFMHNSGTVLAVLSLGRPVLVPDNAMNRALATEVGEGWVYFFKEDLSAHDIEDFMGSLEASPPAPARLDARSWADAGDKHADAYLDAIAHRIG